MSGATGVEDVGVTEQLKKSVVRLHCVWCGDTMFVMDAGSYVCIACNVRQEIIVRFGNREGFEQFADVILPEEIHIIMHAPHIGVNLLHEVTEGFKK